MHSCYMAYLALAHDNEHMARAEVLQVGMDGNWGAEPKVREWFDDEWSIGIPTDGRQTAVVAQAILVGNTFDRTLDVSDQLPHGRLTMPVRSEVGVALNDGLAEIVYEAVDDEWLSQDHVPDLPIHLAADIYGEADVRPRSLGSVRSRATTRGYHDVDARVRARGGDPDARIPKPASSFRLSTTPAHLARVRAMNVQI